MTTTTHRFYRIKTGSSGSFLCPPGHPRHSFELWEYQSPRHRNEIGIGSIDNALHEEANASPELRARVQRIMDEAEPVCSEAWVRHVYGYFRNSYAPEDLDRNVSRSVTDRAHSLPAERHLAVLCIREYFPGHEPRLDLIGNPGNGYGAPPCTKCGEQVQYEAKFDKLAKVTTHMDGTGMTHWTYGTECADGGDHAV